MLNKRIVSLIINYLIHPYIIGQLFRSCLRFEPNWIAIQTPPTTICPLPIDPLLVHDLHNDYASSVDELARIYREAIMDIMYVYRFSSDVDLLCRFDSSSSQHKTPLTRQQTDSACLIADSAQVELKQLIRRIRRLFYQEFRFCDKTHSIRCHANCTQCANKKMAKASALYVLCYTDTRHARRMLSLPWLFAPLLIETRKLNIKKQTKLCKFPKKDFLLFLSLYSSSITNTCCSNARNSTISFNWSIITTCTSIFI
jgi:hypothetical protein